MEAWLAEFPPIEQPQRFGNKAFRQWYDKVAASAVALVEPLLPDDKRAAAVELGPYLAGSVGNSTRLDYGTGHETTFVVLLVALDELGLFSAGDYACVPLVVFAAYIKLVRTFQRRYMLEPAGSHGVWSLDDYQFLPFLWGSAQLCRQTAIASRQVLNVDAVKRLSSEYLYMAAIEYIYTTKRGPFFEHSSMLHQISDKGWEKINEGMFKMYKVEVREHACEWRGRWNVSNAVSDYACVCVWCAQVLGKVPIMQHLLFGSLFPRPF